MRRYFFVAFFFVCAMFLSEGSAHAQLSCSPGNYSTSIFDLCSPCPSGSFCTGGTAQPQTCPAGNFCPVGSAIPQSCPGGLFCPTGSAAAIVCPAGSYCPSGSAAPTVCQAGHVLSGRCVCEPVPCRVLLVPRNRRAATFALSGISARPVQRLRNGQPRPLRSHGWSQLANAMCLVGFFAPNAGAIACTPAPAGSFVGTTGAIAAQQCPAGLFSNVTGAASSGLPGGQLFNERPDDAYYTCAPGSFAANEAQSSCACAAGRVSGSGRRGRVLSPAHPVSPARGQRAVHDDRPRRAGAIRANRMRIA